MRWQGYLFIFLCCMTTLITAQGINTNALHFNTNNFVSTIALTPNQWYHIAVTRELATNTASLLKDIHLAIGY